MISFELLDNLITEVTNRLKNGDAVTNVRADVLRRSGTLAQLMKSLPQVPSEQRARLGAHANDIKRQLEQLLLISRQSTTSHLDLTLPIHMTNHGHEHPIQRNLDDLYAIFGQLGFQPFLTPEIESEANNFDALRVPSDHPARDMQDTFWTSDAKVLRTHTTSFQKQALEQLTPPFAIVQGGKIYRAEAEDATHLSEFHHFDGFAVAPHLTFAHLKGVLTFAMQQLFGQDSQFRFRPSYFPFVEPGAEIDMRCPHCSGRGCRSCGTKGWLELLGCGMTHPEILQKAGLDATKYHGIAWGMGVERLAMIRYQIEDIREFTKNDPRFLEQIV